METTMSIETFSSFLAAEQVAGTLHEVLRKLTALARPEDLQALLSAPTPTGTTTAWSGWGW